MPEIRRAQGRHDQLCQRSKRSWLRKSCGGDDGSGSDLINIDQFYPALPFALINAWAIKIVPLPLRPLPMKGRGEAEEWLKSGQDGPSSGGGEEDSKYQQCGSCLPSPTSGRG